MCAFIGMAYIETTLYYGLIYIWIVKVTVNNALAIFIESVLAKV